jgi:hypothetical protein
VEKKQIHLFCACGDLFFFFSLFSKEIKENTKERKKRKTTQTKKDEEKEDVTFRCNRRYLRCSCSLSL